MKILSKYKYLLIVLTLAFSAFAFKKGTSYDSYKCMMQMLNYQGEGAYIVISLMDSDGKYVETLNVRGDDEEWYEEIPSWWKYFKKNKVTLDAITGATLAGGDRSVSILDIYKDKIDAGYKLRFETCVEHGDYNETDLEVDLTSENLTGKFEGKGYIRYIRIMPQQ